MIVSQEHPMFKNQNYQNKYNMKHKIKTKEVIIEIQLPKLEKQSRILALQVSYTW